MAQYVFFLLAAPLVSRLPRSLLTLIGEVAGATAYVFASGPRHNVLRNLRTAFPDWPERKRRSTAVSIFVHAVWGYIELLGLRGTTADQLLCQYRLDGWQHVVDARAQGHGIVMVSAHVGTPSVAGQVVGLSGAPSTVIVEQLQPPALHDLIRTLREAFALRMIVADRSSVRQILTLLRSNELIGILGDRDVVGTGTPFPFFGRETRMTTAAATFAIRTGAVVLPAIGYRTRLFEGVAQILPPVEMPHTGVAADDVREGTLRIVRILETFIRQHPEQWVVFEDIWQKYNAENDPRNPEPPSPTTEP